MATLRRRALFLGPAAFFLIVWIVYPTLYTIGRSFFGRDGFQDFVWFDNYKSLFTITCSARRSRTT